MHIMKHTVDTILPHVFKRNSLLWIPRTGLETALYYLARKPLPKSDKPALFTMNIHPPMFTVWYHLAKKYLGDSVDITAFDCSGRLKKKEFPGVRIHKFLNLYAATKSQIFLEQIANHR